MIIDAYTHILPQKYQSELEKRVGQRDQRLNTARYAQMVPTLGDLDARFRLMDKFDGYIQVISIASPHIYEIAPPAVAVDLCKIANDELAELIYKYPDRFVGGIAALPLSDVDASIKEAERAMKDLRLKAVEFTAVVTGKPLDAPEFLPLYEKMVELDRPIFIHPAREMTTPDYEGEELSKYRAWTKLGWPYSTALAMTRLVCSGIMEKFPTLQIVTHHCGGLIPFLAGRLDWNDDFNDMRMGHRDIYLKDRTINYYKQFYYDTAVNGWTAGLRCGLEFAGVDKLVFATDMPFDSQNGLRFIRDTIESVNNLGLSEADKKKVFEGNVTRIMRLPFCEL